MPLRTRSRILRTALSRLTAEEGSTTSGVVWQPGVIVTTHHGLRLRENIQIIFAGESLSARLIGSDATTDLAVLGIDSDKLTPAPSANDLVTRAGEVVLSVGCSQLGDISASCGIIAAWGLPRRIPCQRIAVNRVRSLATAAATACLVRSRCASRWSDQ